MTSSITLPTRSTQTKEESPKTSQGSQIIVALCAILSFPFMLAVWLSFDYSYPMWDAASHIHDSIKYEHLFRHPHFWNINWIKEFLSVNPAYPLTIHATNGLLKTLFGIGRATESLSLVLFSIGLSASVYATGRMLFNNRVAACLSVLILNCYPLVALLSHSPMLDFPQLSLCCIAMMTLVWWQRSPSYTRAVLAGIALALAATSKQTAALYLIGPCLYLLINAARMKQIKESLQLVVSGSITASAIALWILPNLVGLKKYLDYNSAACQTNRSVAEIFCSSVTEYIGSIQGSMSPLLFLLAIGSLGYLTVKKRDWATKLLLPAIGATTGIVLMSLQSCNNPEPRYVVPALLFPALATGACLAHLSTTARLKAAATVVGVTVLAIAQFVLFNYSPYPIHLSPKQTEMLRTIAGHPTVPGKMEPSYNPTPDGDLWKQRWAMKLITKANGNQLTVLNILPSTPELSPHTMNLVAAYEGAHVECSTFRQYTLRGDIVRFDQAAIDSYPWYLIKTGFQGFFLQSKESEDNYNHIAAYVKESGKYEQVAQTDLPDGSKLMLYGRKK